MRVRAAVLPAVLLCSLFSLAQNTINVPADQPTIQAGINAANNGDTVLVGPGTYFENINFNGKNITLASTGSGATVIDGSAAAASVITINHGETSATVQGFTIQNGSSMSGGGIEIKGANAVIRGNVITQNRATFSCGIDVSSGTVTIDRNTITANTSIVGSSSGAGGGGIGVAGNNTQSAHLTITNNTITNNAVNGPGAGISFNYFSDGLVQNNYIAGNSGYEGAVYLHSYLDTNVVQNLIVNNTSRALIGGNGGGGISALATNTSQFNVVSNTLYGNTSNAGPSGIYFDAGTGSMLANNIVYASSGNTLTCASTYQTGPAYVFNNLAFNVTGTAWAGNCSSGSNNNLAADPLFADPANGNFHLQSSGSPAVDAGSANAPDLPSTDYDGSNRFADPSNQCAFLIDAGVYESHPAAFGSGTFNPFVFGYPDQLLGTTSAAQFFQLTNTSSACLRVGSQLVISGDFAIAGSSCGAALPPGQSCNVSATFTPTALGSRTGMLGVLASGAGSPGVALNGNGIAPQASVTPTSLNFGNQNIHTTSAPQSISLTNAGSGSLTITSISVGGSFSQTNNCGTSVAAGVGCTIQVTFSPGNNLGTQSSSVVIASNSQVPAPSVSVTGAGVAPQATLSPTSLTFSGQALGTTSSAQSVTVQNTGSGTLTLSGFTMNGDFAETDNCPASLAQGASCTLQVTFTPHEIGSRSGSLSVTSNSVNAVPPATLSGTGNAAEAVVSPVSLSFNQVVGTTSPAQTVALTNPGNVALSITSITATQPFAQTNNCGASLAAGASCTISVTYSPANVGTHSGSVTITDNAYQNPTQTVTLSGTSGQPTVSVSPASLTFPVTIVGGSSAPQTVTVTDTSSVYPLTISSISINNQQFQQTNNCPAQLAPGQACTITVIATPAVSGAVSATLVIADNASVPNPQSVSLSGSGGVPAASISPASLTFATTAVGAQSTGSAVTLSNSGPVAMTISSIATSANFVQSNNCGTSLAAGTSCTINVSFAPTGAGTLAGQLTVTDNASPAKQTVSLSGSAVDFTVNISQTSVSINAGQTASFDVKPAAVGGTYPTTITLSCSGAPAGSTCTLTPTTLSVGQSAKLKIVTTKGITPSGTYVITVTGTANGVSRSDTTTLIVK